MKGVIGNEGKEQSADRVLCKYAAAGMGSQRGYCQGSVSRLTAGRCQAAVSMGLLQGVGARKLSQGS